MIALYLFFKLMQVLVLACFWIPVWTVIALYWVVKVSVVVLWYLFLGIVAVVSFIVLMVKAFREEPQLIEA